VAARRFPCTVRQSTPVVGLTRATALQLGRHGITVNAICPGPIDTEMLRPALPQSRQQARLIRYIPAGRLGTPRDVAGVAYFLARRMTRPS